MPSAERRQRAAEGHPDILSAAARIVAARGYERTRFADIAAEADVSISTLQYLFHTRENLVNAALEFAVERELSEMEAWLSEIEDPKERLVFLIRTFVAGDTHDETHDEWLMWSEYWRAAIRHEHLRESCRRAYARWERLMRDNIVACAEAGLFPLPDHLDELLRGAVAFGDGLGVQVMLNIEPSWHHSAERFLRHFERALGTDLGAGPV